MMTFLLILLTIIVSGGVGWVYGWLTGGQSDTGDTLNDPAFAARRARFDIAADVRRAEQQIQRLTHPSPGQRSQL